MKVPVIMDFYTEIWLNSAKRKKKVNIHFQVDRNNYQGKILNQKMMKMRKYKLFR